MKRSLSIGTLLALLLLGACSRPGGGPNILLVTIDTLRADHVHCYGYEAIRTPVLDSLAASGVLFEHAYTPIPVTLPSHTTILSGLYPHQHGVRDNGVYRVPDELEMLPEILHARGYETAAFVGAYVVHHSYGIDQGFDRYDDEMEEPIREKNPILVGSQIPGYTRRWVDRWTKPYHRRAEVVVGKASQWLRGRSGEKPFFCWVHLFDPHMPYTPPDPWNALYDAEYDGPVDGTAESLIELSKEMKGMVPMRHIDRMIALYDGEVSYADHWVGELLKEIPDSTFVVLLSDHGEALGEHGEFFEHMRTLYRETTHVPLILSGEGVARGERRKELVSTLDVLPTVLDKIGLAAPRDLPGRSLLKQEDGGGGSALYVETMCSRTAVPTAHCWKGLRTKEWSMLFRYAKPSLDVTEQSLYHLESDRDELANVYGEQEAVREELRREYERLLALGTANERNPANFWSLEEDDERVEALRSLGYVEE
jgi:choline-sulfatase